MKFFSDAELARLLPAEEAAFPSPIPTQIVSSDEYLPTPRTAKQREVEARIKEQYEKNGPGRSNLRYGYVARPNAA